jgi:hypothetical protein
MGHYYAEMYPNGEDHDFGTRWANYQKKRATEINKIISQNPIEFEEISIGDKLSIYAPLKGLSKIRFNDQGEFLPIRDLFDCRSRYYSWEMWNLALFDEFTVYDKKEVKDSLGGKTHSQIRTNVIPREGSNYNLDWPMFEHWISIKYFQKK